MTAETAETTWRSRIVGAGTADPSELTANPRNWRSHPTSQGKAMTAVLERVGWVQQVVVNKSSGHLIDGHLRVELAVERGESSLPVLYVELDDEEEALVLASLDPLGGMASVDEEKLAELLAEVSIEQDDLERYLLSLRATGRRSGLTDPDDIPEPVDDPGIEPGEVWQLGQHRLLCGDATDPAAVERLLDGAEPSLLVTDPPYGVSLDLTWRDRAYNGMGPAERPYMVRASGHHNATISGDTRVDWSEVYALVPSLTVGYVWHAGIHAGAVAAGLVQVGFELVAQVIWDKGLFAMGRSWYHWAHEPCWVVRKPGAKAPFLGTRDQGTVWRVPQMKEEHAHPAICCEHQTTIWRAPSPKMIMAGSGEERFDHPAQKPVILYDIPIANHRGDVYDPFCGAGTSIIAAEQQGRRCYAVEIEPRYARIAIDRWQAFTGQEAVRDG